MIKLINLRSSSAPPQNPMPIAPTSPHFAYFALNSSRRACASIKRQLHSMQITAKCATSDMLKVKIKTRQRLKIAHLAAQSIPISNYWHTINDWRTLHAPHALGRLQTIFFRGKCQTNSLRFKCQTITHRNCVRNGIQLNWNRTTEMKTVTCGWMIIIIIVLLFISFGPSNCLFLGTHRQRHLMPPQMLEKQQIDAEFAIGRKPKANSCHIYMLSPNNYPH